MPNSNSITFFLPNLPCLSLALHPGDNPGIETGPSPPHEYSRSAPEKVHRYTLS